MSEISAARAPAKPLYSPSREKPSGYQAVPPAPVLVNDHQFDRATRCASPHHLRADSIESRECLGQRGMLALKCRLPSLVRPPRLHDAIDHRSAHKATAVLRRDRQSVAHDETP